MVLVQRRCPSVCATAVALAGAVVALLTAPNSTDVELTFIVAAVLLLGRVGSATGLYGTSQQASQTVRAVFSGMLAVRGPPFYPLPAIQLPEKQCQHQKQLLRLL